MRAFGLDEANIQHLGEHEDPDLRLYEIRSPMDGTVIMRHITKGEFIDKSAKIYEIADLSTLWVEMGIYPKDLHQIKKGQMIEIINPIEENAIAQGKLIYVSPVIGDETIAAKAIAELDNAQGKWCPGSFVKVSITTNTFYSPLVVPLGAIQKMGGNGCVLLSALLKDLKNGQSNWGCAIKKMWKFYRD